MWHVSECDQVKINNLDTCCEWAEEVRTKKRDEYAITKEQTLANGAEYFHIYLRTHATYAYTIIAKTLFYYGLVLVGTSHDYSVLSIIRGKSGEQGRIEGGLPGYSSPNPQNRNLKNTDFLDIVISNV
jgi:hypothetical protein